MTGCTHNVQRRGTVQYMIDEEAVQNQEVRQCADDLRVACEIPSKTQHGDSKRQSVRGATDHNADEQSECRDDEHDKPRRRRPPLMRFRLRSSEYDKACNSASGVWVQKTRAGGGGATERTAGRAVRGAGGNEGYEQKEERVVRALCDANVEPYAVVIEVVHASVAYAAVL